MSEFPPKATQVSDIDKLVMSLGCTIEGRSAIYVSSPLTTGRLAAEWHETNRQTKAAVSSEIANDFITDVVKVNRELAASYVRRLRSLESRVVVDPSALDDLPGWTQSDYRVLWGRVIEEYCEVVVFRDGWEHSSGCAYEFHVAVASNAHLVREDLTPLPMAAGRSLLLGATDEARRSGRSTAFLEGVLNALK